MSITSIPYSESKAIVTSVVRKFMMLTGNRYSIPKGVVAVINKLFATEPYKTFKTFFNVHTVFRASKESGADHPDANPPIVKDTVYDASYNTGGTARCLMQADARTLLVRARWALDIYSRRELISGKTLK